MKGVEIRWEVEDGYVGKSRPQTTIIPFEDWDDAQEAGEIAVEALITDSVQDDFNERILWNITGGPEDPRD